MANWGYLDATVERDRDEMLSHDKARIFCFHNWADSEEKLLQLLRQ